MLEWRRKDRTRPPYAGLRRVQRIPGSRLKARLDSQSGRFLQMIRLTACQGRDSAEAPLVSLRGPKSAHRT